MTASNASCLFASVECGRYAFPEFYGSLAEATYSEFIIRITDAGVLDSLTSSPSDWHGAKLRPCLRSRLRARAAKHKQLPVRSLTPTTTWYSFSNPGGFPTPSRSTLVGSSGAPHFTFSSSSPSTGETRSFPPVLCGLHPCTMWRARTRRPAPSMSRCAPRRRLFKSLLTARWFRQRTSDRRRRRSRSHLMGYVLARTGPPPPSCQRISTPPTRPKSPTPSSRS